MREKKTILVIMDESSKRDAVTVTLTKNHYNVHTAVTAKDAINTSMYRHHHMILLYVDTHSEALIKSLRKSYDGPIIVLIESPDEGLAVKALDAGANDILVLPFGRPVHMARIRAALRFWLNIPGSMTSGTFVTGGLTIDYASRQITVDGRPVRLTPIEYRIFTLLTRNAGKVMTHDQIINEVWGPYNSDNLVLRVNMANIRRKIEKNPTQPMYVLTEVGVGYRVVKPA